jgi:hypothetical protein
MTARVRLKPGQDTPYHVKQRPLHPEDEAALERQLTVWRDQKVIEPSFSEWSSALLAVTKNWFCLYLRPLNARCEPELTFLGSIEANFQKLSESALYSSFDLSSGFLVIGMEEKLRDYFSLSTPSSGSWRFSRCPFGWRNSHSFFSRFMFRLISTMPPGTAPSYLDDILLYSKDRSGKEMINLIDQFLTRVKVWM